MIIKEINALQFAGKNNLKKNFTSGLNIVLGNNESGKTTLIDCLFQTLFQERKYKLNSDKEFLDSKFPLKADGTQSQMIKCSVEFEIDGKPYTLTKKWIFNSPADSSTELITPYGPFDNEAAETEMQKLLIHGRETYREIVFSSQRDTRELTKILLPKKDNEKKENENKALITSAELSKVLISTALATPNVPTEVFKNDIEGSIKELCTGWDLENDKPSGKGNQEIKKLYDIKTESENNRNRIIDNEKKVNAILDEIKKISDKINHNKELQEKYDSNQEQIRQKKDLNDQKAKIEEKLKKDRIAYKNWPELIDKIKIAEDIQAQFENAEIKDNYDRVKNLKDVYDQKKFTLENTQDVKDQDLDTIKKLEQRREIEENRLKGGNLTAFIKHLDIKDLTLSYVDGNDPIDLTQTKEIAINRSVELNIPDKLDIIFAPNGVNPETIKEEILRIDNDRETILAPYGVNTLTLLTNKKEKYKEIKKEVEEAKKAFENGLKLIEETWDSLEEKYTNIPKDTKSQEAVQVHLDKLKIKKKDLSQQLSDWRATVNRYNTEYDYLPPEKLSDLIEKQEKQLKEIENQLSKIIIPEDVKDLNKSDLINGLKNLEKTKDDLTRSKLVSAKAPLVNEKPIADYDTEILQTESKFEGAKQKARRWKNILERFTKVYDQVNRADVSTLEQHFNEYIQLLTNGSITVNGINNNLDAPMISGDNQLVYHILSEGTRETIELAFRLAMLDEIYPDGGGFAVFDDPLANMDPERTAQACKLLKKFSEKNQVIIVTCHPEHVETIKEGTAEGSINVLYM